MNGGGPLDLRTAILLLAGAVAVYIAFLHPAFGTALLVGISVVALLHLLMGRGDGDPPESP
ncbi:hypothetical protein OG220_19285 [Streptomyces sp. NBC_01187]|nr:hypothetical protein OG220_19285 [Streptomyces sp. NBC_01187]